MAYGDPSWEIAKTASVVYATTALAQELLLTDNSLSTIYSLDEVFKMDVELTGANSFRIAPSALSNDFGINFTAASRTGSLPLQPMKVSRITALAAYNTATSANASANYIFWRRLPL